MTPIVFIAILATGRLQAAHGAQAPVADILGVAAGDPFDEARERLARLCPAAPPSPPTSGPRPARSDEDDDQAVFRPTGSPYKIIVIHATHDRVSWVTAFVRDPLGIPFAELGDLKSAKTTPSMATWEVRAGAHPYRVLAQGAHARATVLTILSPPVLRGR